MSLSAYSILVLWFLQILREEIHDLLDPNPPSTELVFGGGLKALAVGKPPIQIRETTNGGITLAGVTEADVKSLEEMAACLEQGSLCRATGSTNMNSHSRSAPSNTCSHTLMCAL